MILTRHGITFAGIFLIALLAAGLSYAAEQFDASGGTEPAREEAQSFGYDKFGARVPTQQTYDVYPTLSCETVERLSQRHVTTILGGNDQGWTDTSYWGDATPDCE